MQEAGAGGGRSQARGGRFGSRAKVVSVSYRRGDAVARHEHCVNEDEENGRLMERWIEMKIYSIYIGRYIYIVAFVLRYMVNTALWGKLRHLYREIGVNYR